MYNLHAIYESFVRYCRSVGVEPPEFKQWREVSEKMQGFHNTPCSIIQYVK